MPPRIDAKTCTRCGRCVEVCPLDVLRMVDGAPAAVYAGECWHCGACAMECPSGALRVELPLHMHPVVRRVKP
ncbi:TPA: 4Fe-4S binding protein [Candidatus Bathyarchaeota archaeon]|nr:4Fe-4S binding protein [Candidatus Bathyarchaeota archaeon]